MDWKPIESAPKDRSILVYGQPTDIEGVRFTGKDIYVAYWDDIDSSYCIAGASWRGPFIRPEKWMECPEKP